MLSLLAALSFWTSAPTTSAPIALAHWSADGSLVSAVGGAPLEVLPPRAARFETERVGEIDRTVLAVARGAKVLVPTGLRPRGQGFIGTWSLVVDMRIGETRKSYACGVLQTDRDNDDAAEFFANSARGIGFERRFHEGLKPGQWHRIVFVVDRETNTASIHVDGTLVASVNRLLGDSRYTLEPDLLLLADRKLTCPGVSIAGVHVRTEALSPDAIKALGDPATRPLASLLAPPKLGAVTLRALDGAVLAADTPIAAETPVIVEWQAENPSGAAAIIARESTDAEATVLGLVPLSSGAAVIRTPRATTAGQLGVEVVGTNAKKVTTETTPPRSLLVNGDFEGIDGRGAKRGAAPAGWLLTGAPSLTKLGAGFHLASSAGDWQAEQVVPVPADIADKTTGAWSLTIGADMRRELRAGRFDDIGNVSAVFEDAHGRPLGAVSTLNVESQGWARREATSPIPAGTRQIRARLHATHRRGGLNSVRIDNVVASIAPTVAVAELGLRKRPVVHATESPMRYAVVFETVGAALAPIVRWKTADGAEKTAFLDGTSVDSRHQIWRADLEHLTPGETHTYTVELGPMRLGPYSFRAPNLEPEDGGPASKLRVAWVADNQYGWETFTRLLPMIAAFKPDLMVLAGDIVQNGDQRREWQTEWYSPLATEAVGQTVPIQFARGNHDGEHALSYAYTHLPGNGAWFAYTRGGIRFIFLDTEAEPDKVHQQVRWLKRELQSPASREASFRIAIMHKPPYANRWDSPEARYDGERAVREHFVPLFHHNDVDLVVAGHAHCYQRRDFQGVRYVVVGGGGGRLDKYPSASWPMTVDWVGHHFAILDVEEDQLSWEARSIDGETIDTFTLKSHTHKKTAAKQP